MTGIIGNIKDHLSASQISNSFCQGSDAYIRLLIGYIICLAVPALQQDTKQRHRTIHHISPRTERLSLTLQYDILTTQYIADKLGIDTIIILCKERTVDMTRTGDGHLNAILMSIADTKRLGSTFCRRIARPHRSRINIPAIAFFKDTTVALAIDFSGRYIDQFLQAVLQSKAQQIIHAEDIRLHHSHWILAIKLWTGTASSIHDIIERDIHRQGSRNIKRKKMIMSGIKIRRKAPVSPLFVTTRSINLIIQSLMLHQHINQTATNQSSSAQHQDILARKLLPWQLKRSQSRLYIFII